MSGPNADLARTVQLLADINRLTVKSIKAKNLQQLVFIILNDTVPIVRYDRGLLWKIPSAKKPELLGVSGQSAINKKTDLNARWQVIVNKIQNPDKPQVLITPELPDSTSVLWMPIFSHEKLSAGLWLERWNNVAWSQEEIEILEFLSVSFGAAFEKFDKKTFWHSIIRKPSPWAIAGILLLLLLVRIPLRIVAPCEVVPKDPVVITAPLEGIIEKIDVTPGDDVKKGQLLFEYDKRVPLQDLRIAQEKLKIIKSEYERSTALAQRDKKALAELAVEELKVRKEELELELAEYRASQLEVSSPIAGVALFDNPEEWHGKPVKIGEKVMVVANPSKTKVRMWVPEDDNIVLDKQKNIKVILNVSPEISREARIIYIASYTTVSTKQVPSFEAEAEWVGDQSDVKLGLKGTAIIYGQEVSLFYWIVRKPYAYVRRYFGI